VLAHFFILLGRKFEVIVDPVEVAMETGLKRKAVHDVELSPHDDTGGL